MDIRAYSTTAASNTADFPEGQSPGSVNDEARELQAELAQYLVDQSGSIDSAGSSTAYTLTLSTAASSLANGLDFSFTCDETNTGASTLNVTPNGGVAFGAKKIRKIVPVLGEVDLVAGDMIANGHYYAQYDAAADSATGAYILHNPNTEAMVFLTSGSISAAATQDITLTSGFWSYKLILTRIEPVSAANLLLRFDQGSGVVTSTNYHFAGYQVDQDDAVGSNSDTGVNAINMMLAQQAAAGNGTQLEIMINPGGTSQAPSARWTGGSVNATDTIAVWGFGRLAVGGAATSVRLLYSTGNISTGRYQLYGMRS